MDSNGETSPPAYDDVVQNGGVEGYENVAYKDSKGNGEVALQNGASNSAKKDDDDDKKGEEEKKEDQPTVGAMEVFRFAGPVEILLILGGTLAACLHGACLPIMIIIFGDMTDSFISNDIVIQFLSSIDFTQYNTTQDAAVDNTTLLGTIVAAENKTTQYLAVQESVQSSIVDEMEIFALYYIGIALGVFVMGHLQISLWLMASIRQTNRIRQMLFQSILKQEIGWFDTEEPGTLITRMTDGVNEIRDGIGDKIGNFFQWFSGFIVGFIIGFAYGWKLSLVILAISPLLAACGIVMTKLASSFTSKEMDAYAKAGAVAEEVISSIRTVLAFGGQKKESARYNANLDGAYKYGVRKGLVSGGGMGLVMFVIFAVYCFAFWYGSKLVREDDKYTPGNMLIVFFSIVIAAFSLGNAAPNLQNYATARGAAYTIFKIIDNQPHIDSSSEEGLKPKSVTGDIEFTNVKFRYPSRPEVAVMDGFSLSVKSGKTVALVGASGCGKSTSVQLLQRFYDPLEGSITLDGNDLKDLNVKWLRTHIGVVSQEPVLFAATIRENIRYGRDGVSDAEIEAAAKNANAHDFIMALPDKYETLVGERGAQISGGQKQRIAIARALVRDPKILLLDEATSALDTESEGIVQAALDKAKEGRTTIVIAHRLSTVRNADVIVGISDGVVKEQGSHSELMEMNGIYNMLVSNQSQAGVAGDDEEDPEAMFRLARQMSDVKRSSGKALIRQKSAVKKSGDDKKEEEEKLADPPLLEIMRLNRSETPQIIIGCIASLINGFSQPIFGVIFSFVLAVYAEPDLQKQEEDALFWSMMFLVIGIAQGLATLIQGYTFALAGEALTRRLREKAFISIMRQDLSYFDDPKNTTGALTTRLSTDASAVHGATGSRLGVIIQSISSILVGVIIGFYYSYKLTFVVLAFAPFIMAAGWLQMKVIAGQSTEGQDALEDAGKVANESISNMRTVAMLNKEQLFYEMYCERISGPFKSSIKRANLNGLTFGLSQGILFVAYAVIFYFGGWLIEHDGLDFGDMFIVFAAIVFGAMAMGQANSFAPDYEKAKQSAARMFILFEREPLIKNDSTEGEKPSDIVGSVEFKDVKFSYPMRPEVQVLRGLNLSVEPGQMLALVGSSGCGKSTTIQLLERFYNAAEGSVLIGNNEIEKLNIGFVRAQMGLVQQEPILFDCSLKDNIAYGDNSREVPMNEIIEAARNANIHDFISSLPQGYETSAGDKGTQLSGGQKQRIAIARALVRNPKILLLDEATSALDTESEKVVQEALDRAQEGRTSIVIAHRLSTVQKADMIVVIFNGKVVESGTHSQLMALRGFYFRLNEAQINTI